MPFDGTEIQPFYPESDNSHETLRIFYPCQVFQKGNALSEKIRFKKYSRDTAISWRYNNVHIVILDKN